MDIDFLLGEINKYTLYIPLILQAFAFTFILTPIIGRFASDLNILDKPPSAEDKKDPERHRRLEKAPRPLWGGIAVVLPFLILGLIYIESMSEMNVKILGLFLGILILLGVGIMDDIVRFNWKVQLLGQILAICVAIVAGIGINVINNPFDGYFTLNFITIPFEVFWLQV